MKSYFVLALVILLATTCASVQASTVYRINFDGASATDPYTPGPGDILPAGISSQFMGSASILTPAFSGFEGGNVMDQSLGGIWPNVQGYRFGADGVVITGTPGPAIYNTFTIEAIIRPDLSGGVYAPFLGQLTDNSTIFGSSAHNGVSWQRATNISIDQNTGLLTLDFGMAAGGNPYGNITSTTVFQTGQWYHIAAVTRIGNPQRTELWVNGVLEATGGYVGGWETQNLYAVPGYFAIGSTYGPWFTQRNYQGQIDAVAISDTALATGSFVLPTSYPPLMGGIVTLPNYSGDLANVGLEIQLRPHGSTIPTYTDRVFLNASGGYGLSSGLIVTPGTYDVAFKTQSTLRTVVQSVSIPGALVNVTLTNGDVDGNNSIGVMDHSIVSGSFGTSGNQ